MLCYPPVVGQDDEIAHTLGPQSLDGRAYGRNSMAKGLYLMRDGQVLVEYGRRRRVPIPPAQYKANGYRPPCHQLPAEAPPRARKELAHTET